MGIKEGASGCLFFCFFFFHVIFFFLFYLFCERKGSSEFDESSGYVLTGDHYISYLRCLILVRVHVDLPVSLVTQTTSLPRSPRVSRSGTGTGCFTPPRLWARGHGGSQGLPYGARLPGAGPGGAWAREAGGGVVGFPGTGGYVGPVVWTLGLWWVCGRQCLYKLIQAHNPAVRCFKFLLGCGSVYV